MSYIIVTIYSDSYDPINAFQLCGVRAQILYNNNVLN